MTDKKIISCTKAFTMPNEVNNTRVLGSIANDAFDEFLDHILLNPEVDAMIQSGAWKIEMTLRPEAGQV